MRAGMRVLLATLALFPFLAPYELLIGVEWQQYTIVMVPGTPFRL
jgi:hypothetical protein